MKRFKTLREDHVATVANGAFRGNMKQTPARRGDKRGGEQVLDVATRYNGKAPSMSEASAIAVHYSKYEKMMGQAHAAKGEGRHAIANALYKAANDVHKKNYEDAIKATGRDPKHYGPNPARTESIKEMDDIRSSIRHSKNMLNHPTTSPEVRAFHNKRLKSLKKKHKPANPEQQQ